MPLWIALLAFVTTEQTPEWVPTELRDGSRYRILEAGRRDFEVQRSDGVRILLDNVASSSPLHASKPIRMSSPREQVPLASGSPLARQLYIVSDPGRVSIHVVGEWEQLTLRLLSPILSEGGRRFNRPDDLAAEGRWAEAIARKAFAAYASRRLGPAETVTVNGRSVASRRADKSNAEMVDLGEWASAVGTTVTRDPNGDAWTFVRGGASHTLALGADKVKVGGVWKPMPDAPMLKDGRVFVPRSALPS